MGLIARLLTGTILQRGVMGLFGAVAKKEAPVLARSGMGLLGKSLLGGGMALEAYDQIKNNGEGTKNLLGAGGRALLDGGISAIGGSLKALFNGFMDDLAHNGYNVAVPVAMAIGAMNGDGLASAFTNAALWGGIAYAGVKIAEQNGYKTQGMSFDFKSASAPAPTNQAPARAPVPSPADAPRQLPMLTR